MAGSTKTLLTSFVLSNAGINETIRRTLGGVYVSSDQAAASENYSGAFGICVVTDAALAAGAASIPGPFTEQSDDIWVVWMPVAGSVTVGGTPGNVARLGWWFPFDSRAMRRVQEGQGIAVMFETAAADGVSVTAALSLYSTFAT